MILFEDDWKKYPRAIIDVNTANKSFVRLASVYRSMGIKNNAFLLVLINPDLQGVDPFDYEHLTMEQMALIALECRENPWYFFRECARAPGLASNKPVPLEANRGNIALFWCFFNHIMTILIQVRQTGKSFSVDTLVTLLMNILCENTQINLLTKDDVLRRRNIERLKEIGLDIPKYLQQNTKADANNGEELTIKSLGNSFITHVPQSSPKRAYNMGRGLTSPIFFVDEGPFQPNIAIALPAALAATGAAVDSAKKEGRPYGTILTTTAGKKDDRDGRFIFNLMSDSAVWDEKFFDAKDLDALERMVKANSRAGVCRINITLSHRQLGKTDEWLRQKLAESLQTGDDANRDFFNMWTSGSQSNPLSLDILERIARSQMSCLHTNISSPYGYITRWFIPEEEIVERLSEGNYILGMDTSEASGGDDISLVLIDAATLELVCIGTYNETNLITFSEWVCTLLVTFKNITAIIERRSTGGMLLDYLLLMLPQHGIDPFKRLFNRVVNDYDEMPDRWKEILQPMNRRPTDIYVRYKKTFGFATASVGYASRTELYSTTLQNAAKRSCDKIRDKSLIDQITGLITKNGRIDHADGEHDDLVIGWLLANWLLAHGKNLTFYGIDIKRVMSAILLKGTESDIVITNRAEQQQVRDDIEKLYAKLSAEQDPYVAMRLEHDLRMLDKKIVLENGEIYSLDNLIRQAKETKQNKRRGYDYGRNEVDFRKGYADGIYTDTSGVMSDMPLTARQIVRSY